MRFAITGTDPRFPLLRELLTADGHVSVPEEDAEVVIPPPWDPRAGYARSESYLIANAALTAEAAADLLARERRLLGTEILVLGWGRVGSLTAPALRAEGGTVTVFARRRESRAWAEAAGFETLGEETLDAALGRFDVIVNTVPAPLLDEKRLSLTRPGVLLTELASSPGGIDEQAAQRLGRRYLPAPGLPGKYAPARAAEILREAVYETAAAPRPRLGVAMTGSHCCFDMALEALEPLKKHYDLVPILSERAALTDTRFGTAASFRQRLETLCARKAVDSVAGAEPLGTTQALNALLVIPCTGNTLGKLANGITDTAVTMACKAHLRNGRPLVLAISTNDGLSGSAENIARLLQRKNVYFVPFRQDAPHTKPFSLQSDMALAEEALAAAGRGEQLQPVLL